MEKGAKFNVELKRAEDEKYGWDINFKEDTYTIEFQPGSPGIEADWSTGSVTGLPENGQGHRLGVQVGSVMTKVNDVNYTEDVVDAAIASTQPFTIVFEIKSILVTSVLPGGLISRWNGQQRDCPIEPGDVIIEVDGTRGGNDMAKALWKVGCISLVIKKGCADDVPHAPPQVSPERPKMLEILGSFELSSWVPMLVFSFRSQLDTLDGHVMRIAAVLFFVIIAGRLLILFCEYSKIKSVSTDGVVDVPPVVWAGMEVTPGTQANPQAYEIGLWQAQAMEVAVGGSAVLVIFYVSESIFPMAMHLTRTICKFYESPLFRVHILGQSLTRPYGPKPLDWKGIQASQKSSKQD